ncbi:hypothetical protein OESDEN_24714, partial [Oesophagostomum dentatum]
MREDGVPHDEIHSRAKQMIEEKISDPVMKGKAYALADRCKDIYANSRRRRGQELYTLEKVLENYLTWLTDDQKAELKSLKEAGNKDEIYKKIVHYFDGTSGDTKKKALKEMQTGIREHHEHKMDEEMNKYLTWLTPEQKDKLKEKFEKEGREPGYKLVMEFFEASSGDVKAKAKEELKAACKHFGKGNPWRRELENTYGNEGQRRRGQELYTLEKVLENYLTWLTDDQKAELKSLKEAGNKDEIYKKIVQFFDGTSGDTKKKALEDMQTGCKHYIRNVVGDEKADEFKHMRESGVPVDEIAKKIDAIVDGLTNEEVKTQAKKAAVICKAAFSAPKRFRRGQELYTLEKALEHYLTWLTDDQKNELKSLKESGDKDGIYKKVLEYYEAASGDVKKKATEDLQVGCKHYIRNV